jgi:hypothetical protein
LFIAAVLRAQKQDDRSGVSDRAYQLADEKMEVSKLDWIMLTARVRLLEQSLAHEGSHSSSAVGMSYDAQERRVVVQGFVDPDWFGRARLDEVKKVLLRQSTDYCVDGLAMAYGETGQMLAAANVKTDCSVHFFTWTRGKDGKLTRKDIAIGEGGQLVLK